MADDKKQKTLFLDDSSAAPPSAQQPLSSKATMMLDAPAAPAGRSPATPQPAQRPVQGSGTQAVAPLAPPPSASGGAGKWLAGPLLALLVGAGTFFAAHKLIPVTKPAPPVHPMGHLRVTTEPPGATITVDGKRLSHFTPTTLDGEIGATLKLTLSADGYQTKEADVYIAEGEHPFGVKLEPTAAPTPPPPTTPTTTTPPPSDAPAAPAPEAPATTAAAPASEHHHSSSKPKEPAGTATVSITVRPWAIVFVDKQRLRQTPITSYQLPSGKHVIELVNEGKNRREKIEVTLKPGEEQDIRRDWDK